MSTGQPAGASDSNSLFADVLGANATYVAQRETAELPGRAQRGLAVVTCMDSRIDPAAALGLGPGDAVVLRNAGARVTDDVLHDLLLARYLLGVERVAVVGHTRCRAMGAAAADVHQALASAGAPDTRSVQLRVAPDVQTALRADVQRLLSSPYLGGLGVGAFIFDVDTGALHGIA